MATKRKYVCAVCENKRSKRRLFDDLLLISIHSLICHCKKPTQLHLEFPFGLGIGAAPCTVLAAYQPERKARWKDKNCHLVEFFPFLVVVRFDKNRHNGIWLPYWHVVKRAKEYVKYGQWAPQMESGIFADLVQQATKAGFLKSRPKKFHYPWA